MEAKKPLNYSELLNLATSNIDYKTYSGQNVLWFPVQVPQSISSVRMLENIFFKYSLLLGEFGFRDKLFVDAICKTIIEIINQYLTGDVIKAYNLFEEMMTQYDDIFPFKEVETDILFYRMRGEIGLKETKEFYHLPITMRHKCSSERFSIAGYPCFYLGYSKNDCYVEIGKVGSMIGVLLKKGHSIKVLDLTFSEQQQKGESLIKYLKAFPLIAACYVVMNNEIDSNNAKFREEYVIPQMLTSYLKHKNISEGVCYYSVRNENLDPLGRNENDYRNLVLFPDLTTTNDYDMKLMKKFHWFEPFSVNRG